jgi:hypothetical protein
MLLKIAVHIDGIRMTENKINAKQFIKEIQLWESIFADILENLLADEPPGEDATPSSSSKDIETGIQTTEECIVREVGRAQDDSELEESTSTRRVAEGGIKSTTAGVQHQPSSSVNTWCDKTEATSAGIL